MKDPMPAPLSIRARSAAVMLLLAAAVCAAAPQQPAPGGDRATAPRSAAVHCGKLIHSADAAAIDDCWLIIRDGKVAAIQREVAPPADLPVIDASDKVVMPGLVAADSDLSGHGDDRYNVTPDFVAIDGFDFLRSYDSALSGGVTTVYLAPGRNRLISGQGSVVKLAGDDLLERVLAESACLRVTLGTASTQAPPIFEPTAFPTADDPLLPATRQGPSARIAQLATLREIFAAAAAAEPEQSFGNGMVEHRYESAALRRAALGELPLRIAATEAADLRRALELAGDFGGKPVLENPGEIEPLAAQLDGVGIVFRAPLRLSGHNPGGEDRADETPLARLDNPAIAARAGARVAIAPGRNQDLPDLLLLAAIAVRHGLEPRQALAAVTMTAADLLGVGEHVGSLTIGRDADFIVLSGEPLAVGTMVEQTWIDGERVYERETRSRLVAVRASRVLIGDGQAIADGVVLVADGRIKAVGADLAIPYGAQLIEVDGVVVPGFIDANATLGLSGDGVGVPAGNPAQRVADAERADDPSFAAARAAGVTTVCVSGTDGGVISGRVAAIKTGAADDESMVLREIAGLRFVFDALGPDSVKPIADRIDAAKKYREAWQKYEKALADFEAGKTAKPPEPAPVTAPAKVDPLTGTWECEIAIPGREEALGLTLVLKLEGTTVSGTAKLRLGERELGEQAIESGSFQNAELRLTVSFMGQGSELVAKIDGDKLEGSVQAMGQDAPVTGERTAKPGGAAAAVAPAVSDDGRPKKPNVDESLEPIVALLEKRATAIVRSDRAPAIEAVAKLFSDAGIRFALHGAQDWLDTPEIVEQPQVMLGPELVTRDDGELENAAATVADTGATLAIVTGDNANSRYLPLHAMHAVRYGLDPKAALRALTIDPARIFGLDERIGSLEQGKDADLVVFSGNPFEPTSRVLLVMCDGRIVHDGREDRNEEAR